MKGNPMNMIVCHSEDIDTADAANELISQAEEQLKGKIPNGAVLFAAIDYEHQVFLDILTERWPSIDLIGGSTDGELSSVSGFTEDSAVLILFASEDIHFSSGVGILDDDYEKACVTAYQQALNGISVDPRICLTVPGNMSTNNDRIMFHLKEISGGDIPIFGGIPGDQWRFKAQYQFFGNKVYTGAVPILLMGGNLDFVYGIDSGWEPMGEFGVVTNAEGNIVHTIDHKPAMSFYRAGLGELTSPSGEFPLIVFNEEEHILYQRAAGTQSDDESGSIVFLGEIPRGAKVKIAGAERNVILNGTHRSVSSALEKLNDQSIIHGGLIFSCAARKALLGTQTVRESQIVSELIGEKIPYAGFYGYGELSPVKKEVSNSMLHNQTFVTLLFVSH